jgi:hypothetical protein
MIWPVRVSPPRGVHATGNAEVEQLDATDVPAHEKEVGRLEVSVDDPELVGDLERRRDVAHEPQRVADRQGPAEQSVGEVLTLEPLHGEEDIAVGRHAVGDILDDPRMTQLGEDLRLGEEAIGRVLIEAVRFQ